MSQAQPEFTIGHVQFHGKTLQLHELDLLLKHRGKERKLRRLRARRKAARARKEGAW